MTAGRRQRIEAVALAGQVAASLDAAHHHGTVYRDIKCSDFMVTGQGRARIMDFGLAKLQGGPALTGSGTTLGPVACMSPEQASGREVVHRADLSAAGVLLYELLTGDLPFQGGSRCQPSRRRASLAPVECPEVSTAASAGDGTGRAGVTRSGGLS